jgi:LuxR family maltose regulon positive regulatory protein
VNEGEAMRRLIEEMLAEAGGVGGHRGNGAAGPSRRLAYARNLLGAFPSQAPLTQAAPGRQATARPLPSPTAGPARPPDGAGSVEPLTERELEVLRLMAQGLTYEEAAQRLVVSLNTVRFHVKGIYGKLGVDRRAAAIDRARSLGLL